MQPPVIRFPATVRIQSKTGFNAAGMPTPTITTTRIRRCAFSQGGTELTTNRGHLRRHHPVQSLFPEVLACTVLAPETRPSPWIIWGNQCPCFPQFMSRGRISAQQRLRLCHRRCCHAAASSQPHSYAGAAAGPNPRALRSMVAVQDQRGPILPAYCSTTRTRPMSEASSGGSLLVPSGPLDVTAFALNLPGPSVPSGVIVTAYGTATAPATPPGATTRNGGPAGVPKTLIFTPTSASGIFGAANDTWGVALIQPITNSTQFGVRFTASSTFPLPRCC